MFAVHLAGDPGYPDANYRIAARCRNCGAYGTCYLRKGTPRIEEDTSCPVCECRALYLCAEQPPTAR